MAENDNLAKYRAKRDFTKTAEPKGILAKGKGNRYLIQKHEASHLHYDFRLELDGTLKSWAVPRGPSPDPKDKRLAMAVEDHPVAYGSFEGTIPRGEYGGGNVMLWDEGTWEPFGDAQAGIAKGKLVFTVYGERVKGEWTLVKTFNKEGKGNAWLLIKHHDEEERPGDNGALTSDNLTSIVSGRTMEEIAAAGDNVWQSNRDDKSKSKQIKSTPIMKKTPLAPLKMGSAKFPAFSSPQLATLSDAIPKGSEWVHEVKFDGYRMLAYINAGKVTIYSRNGKDWTDAFRSLADRLAKYSVSNAIIDGEIVVLDKNGRSDFSEMKDELSTGKPERFQYYVFDLLFLNGQSTVSLPLTDRKELLQDIIKQNETNANSQRIFFSEHFKKDPEHFLQNLCSLQMEGVVSKRGDAPYHAGRSKTWLKTKCHKRQEFVIGGYTLPSNGGMGIGSLLLGYYDNGNLIYSGRVGTGFTNTTSMQMRKKMDELLQQEKPYLTVPPEGRRGAKWVKPILVAEVEFSEWTPDGSLRHPSFKGLREDKPANSIIREVAVSPKSIDTVIDEELEADIKKPTKAKKAAVVPASTKSAASKKDILVGNIKITHPDRIVYPDTKITKQRLAEYYLSVADHMVPYIKERPLSVIRCPDGIGNQCFFQRHLGLGKSPYLHEVSVGVKGSDRDYMMVEDVNGLLSLIQWGAIELHPWQCAADNLSNPNQMIFDLDPDPEVSWKSLMEGAFEVKQRMEELGLKSFLKTTGGKGLHVVIPMTPAYSFAAIKSFTKAIADSMASDSPSKYLAKMSKAARKGRIFVDYLRNDVTSTAVAAFSVRARPGATVSTPIEWSELTASLKLSSFNIDTVPARLKKLKADPWKDFSRTKQKIAVKYLKALQIEVN